MRAERAAQLLQLRGLALLGGLEFDVDQLAADGRGFGQDVELGGDRAAKLASAGDAPAGGDDHGAGVGFEKMLDLGKRQGGLRNVV